jgi:Holliday junction resolvasome RuvABC endonuclease subunit
MLVVGIDPASNTVGLAVFDPESKELFIFKQLVAKRTDDVHKRIVYLHDEVSRELMSLDPEEQTYAYIENTVMQGRSGQILANATGALMAAVPYWCEYQPIQNTTMKRLIAGTGKAEKVDVARGILLWAQGNAETTEKVRAAIQAGCFDQLDALGIGIAGWMKETGRG